MKPFIFLILLIISLATSGQVNLEGIVKDSKTGEPLPYCNVGVKGTRQGTITNADGKFLVRVVSLSDTLLFSYVGYFPLTVPAFLVMQNKTVFLDPRITNLQEITISAKDDFPYQMMDNCRKRLLKDNKERVAKVYYGLETQTRDQPAELLECYYNGYITGSVLDHLILKNGRIGLSVLDNRFFLSLNTSKAISGMKLTAPGDNCPAIPLQYNKRELKKLFNLSIACSDDKSYNIRFTGKSSKHECFSGNAWIDKENFTLLKIDLSIRNASRHPFLPLFPKDTLSNVNISISHTFRCNGDTLLPDHINFSYNVTYKSVRDTPTVAVRSIITRQMTSNGVLYFYDYGDPFILPYFDYDNDYDDYRKMSFIPYNDVFWKNTSSILLTEKQKQGLGFMAHEGYLINFREGNYGQNFLNLNRKDSAFHVLNSGLYEFYYTFWSPDKRIRLNRKMEKFKEYSQEKVNSNVVSDLYRLNVQLLLDVNRSGDSLNTRSYTVFDAARTYFHLPEAPWTNVFLNIYFDICEIERRKMDEELNSGRHSLEQIEDIYRKAKANMEEITKRYLKEVQTGSDTNALTRWNKVVADKLGINNMEIFRTESPVNIKQ